MSRPLNEQAQRTQRAASGMDSQARDEDFSAAGHPWTGFPTETATQVPKAILSNWASLHELTPHKKEMLTQRVRNALNMAVDLGRHRTLGGEDTTMRYALHGLADGIIAEFFETLSMVDHPEIPSVDERHG